MRGNLIGYKAKPQAKSKLIVLKSDRERTGDEKNKEEYKKAREGKPSEKRWLINEA